MLAKHVAAAADDVRVRDGGALSALADASRPSDPLAAMLGGMDRRRAVRQFVATCR